METFSFSGEKLSNPLKNPLFNLNIFKKKQNFLNQRHLV
ncbi:hypothetical protein A33Q_1019 [Indibacter alkaliphilus LW1]|uniref:Uncharacterized protein n=1 Tax=Indibacter alkaliphilus (strain CCUG 57479 / KCTC 22604 / LW1) TaxID=1189612 RepID=S2DMD6_INDAL|nr:hypothetical protein A33Q_1019 [Indibacter alkaliphilus LW1]